MPDGSSRRAQPAGIWPPQTLLGEKILEATLDLLISLVELGVEDAGGISVSLLSRTSGEFHTPTATSAEVREVDAAQYESHRGPCVEAARTGEPVHVAIASQRLRWPEFAAEATSRGMSSVLSVPLRDDERVIGALNVYSERTQAFAEPDQHVVGHLARQATVVLGHASEFMTSDWISEQVAEAVSRADVIGQAKGILIARGYSPDDALAALRRASERNNRRLSEVAQDMVSSSRRVRPS